MTRPIFHLLAFIRNARSRGPRARALVQDALRRSTRESGGRGIWLAPRNRQIRRASLYTAAELSAQAERDWSRGG